MRWRREAAAGEAAAVPAVGLAAQVALPGLAAHMALPGLAARPQQATRTAL